MTSFDHIVFRSSRLIAFFTVCASLFISNVAFSQYQFNLLDKKKQTSFSFQFQRNLIIIPVQINGKGPFNFILDSGVSILLITDPSLKDSIGVPLGKKINIKGLGEGEDITAFVAPGLDIRIDRVESTNIAGAIISKDILQLSNYVGMPISGIIGYDFFNSFVVKINYVGSTITVYDASKFKAPRGNTKLIPLLIENQRAYVFADTKLNDTLTIRTKLIVDTGAGHPVSLEPGSDPRIKIPDSSLNAHLGVGLSGPIEGHIGRIKKLSLENIELKNVIVSFPEYNDVAAKVDYKRNGNIGNDLLKRFTVTFDYPHARMFLKPNLLFNEPFEHDMSGMELISHGTDYHRYIISTVQPGSPADLSGLKKDDEIIYINFKPVSEMSISEIDNLLRSKDKRILLLQIRRKNTTDYVVLTLKRRV
ncbi:aspartyl protease family protein [Solitalea koreensis]|uniref:Aspartyl protease n=1 Tax=Solitalea koreensis TaxID=543615 RepID=A0A521B0N2_9SPHI|nr:aspartyl protease family protein [Solitalea koreensis]SMO40636.1 Aspartyl protease [Solitalea koreensis]